MVTVRCLSTQGVGSMPCDALSNTAQASVYESFGMLRAGALSLSDDIHWKPSRNNSTYGALKYPTIRQPASLARRRTGAISTFSHAQSVFPCFCGGPKPSRRGSIHAGDNRPSSAMRKSVNAELSNTNVGKLGAPVRPPRGFYAIRTRWLFFRCTHDWRAWLSRISPLRFAQRRKVGLSDRNK